ncbi:MAG: PRD domain-containing protein [Collinsella sp.]|uniref:PRD domain-containing protein n=1 Tax=Collinsella sp. TaxID=1965294 RepID=UPI002E78B72E|nr:PRD domain-containing protein [Collinsella sp.]MEE0703130.1 PRD domain-containing protein [Collinsella sp.]
MLILKKINNNVALASTDTGEEVVVFGKGVGFHEMPYELEDESVIQRVFRDVDEKSIDGFEGISDEVLLVASDIVALADKALDCKLAGNLVISLADHLQYAVERAGEGVAIENPLSHEVAFVYPRETELGHRGVEIVLDRLGVELPESEVTSIALHLVNAEVDGMGSAQDMDLVMKSTVILERATQIIEGQLGQKLDRTSYAYVRFVAHLRFLIRRLMRGSCKETENSGLFRQAARDFPDAYRCAAGFNEYLKREYNWSCSDEEMLYLMMHVNRLRQG